MENLVDFSKIQVLIVGDVMIDRYCWGSVERISPEAPVPVVSLKKTTLAAGGAANVATNVAGLGAKPLLIGAIGNDEEANFFPPLLKKCNVEPDFLIKIKNRPTTVKTRIIAHSQQITRLDQETKEYLSAEDEDVFLQTIIKLIDEADIVVLSDYAKGVLTARLLEQIIATAKTAKKMILIDPKGKNYLKYKGADLLTPNQREISDAAKLEAFADETVESAGNQIIFQLSLQALLVTQGENGMTLFESNKKTLKLKAMAREVYDVTGAGDTVIAVMAVALAAKLSFAEAARLANIAAGLVVEQIGTTAIKFEDLQNSLKLQNGE